MSTTNDDNPRISSVVTLARVVGAIALVLLMVGGFFAITTAWRMRANRAVATLVEERGGSTFPYNRESAFWSFDDIEAIDLAGSRVTDDDLRLIASPPKLLSLDLSNTAITDAGLKTLADAAQSRPASSDEGDRWLLILALDDTAITDDGLREIGRMPQLEWLSLSGTKVSGDGIAHLKSIPNLGRLSLDRTELDPSDLASLADLPSLDDLSLKECSLSEEAVAIVGRLRLKRYWLDKSSVTDDGVRHLYHAQLVALNATSITDAGVESLRGAPHLEVLALQDTQITDEGARSLAAIPRLTKLHIDDTRVGDAGIRLLLDHKGLRDITVGRTQITDAAIEEFTRQRSHIRVTRE